MKRTVTTLGALAALAFPTAAMAQDAPTKQDRTNAAKECKTLRGTTDASREAFAAQFRTLGACVSKKAQEERTERTTARRNAAQECQELRRTAPDRFGRGKEFRNFGACVSTRAKANERAADQQDAQQARARKNAAQQCDSERGETAQSRQAFARRFRTFGACVSQKARAQDDEQQQPA
jgi:hypothetical protein